jgi:DNA polymerase-3 subunit epsilon
LSVPPKVAQSQIDKLPRKPGVYCLYGVDGELLYVGKSVRIRDRIQSHFRSENQGRKQEKLFQETARIEIERTAGNFSASLLELQHIKERQPLLNKQSRKKKQLVVLKEKKEDGYLYPEIVRTKEIDTDAKDNILGVFKSKKQAKSVIENLAREYQLCRKRLRIGSKLRDGPCFYYQLGQCRGACTGEDDPDSYNQRFREAFRDYAVRSWPFEGTVVISEDSADQTDRFIVNRWVIQAAHTYRNDKKHDFFRSVPRPATFNYDTYKTIARVLLNQNNNNKQVTLSKKHD